MFARLQGKIVSFIAANEDMSDEDKELYSYGIQLMLEQALNIISAITIMFIFKEVLFGSVYICTFFAIRQFAGGYHAKTFLRCYGISMLTISSALLTGKLLEGLYLVPYCIIAAVICFAVIFAIAPIDNVNKPLDCNEKLLYRKKCRIIEIVAFIALIIFAILNFNNLVLAITLGFFTAMVLQLLGKFIR